MTAPVFFAVLFAALLHAGWNAWVKGGRDGFTAILLMSVGQSLIAALALFAVGLPPAHSIPWVAGSAVLHTGYKAFLINAYERGDLSQIYPIARGTAPLIVAVAGLLFLGEPLPPARLAAVAAIGGGILLLAIGSPGARLRRSALLLGLGTAAFTAAYSVVDGLGARFAGDASSFILAAVALDGLLILAWAKGAGRQLTVAALRSGWFQGLAAGGVSVGAYWIVVWAFTLAPLALVAALRETSVLFAMLIAAFLLREPVGPRRWVAAGMIVSGIALMRI
ncbi:MAG TPA: EamA family transporter [Allosphingosinicella sp.]|nr:EamA family transporter [Allosphingosinicella sp.]